MYARFGAVILNLDRVESIEFRDIERDTFLDKPGPVLTFFLPPSDASIDGVNCFRLFAAEARDAWEMVQSLNDAFPVDRIGALEERIGALEERIGALEESFYRHQGK